MKTFHHIRTSIAAPLALFLLFPLLTSCDTDDAPAANEETPGQEEEIFPSNENKGDNDEDDDIIWDISPVTVAIYIKDAEGNNLLVSETPGNLQGKKIVAEYEGKDYELTWGSALPSRAYLPVFSGLTLGYGYTLTENGYEKDPTKPFLSFGEFDGGTDQDISMTLSIEGYAGTWKIDFSHRIKWEDKKPVVSNTSFINGMETDGSTIVITL